MSVATIVSRGFGTFGSVGKVVSAGYSSGDNNIISDQDAAIIAKKVWEEVLDGQNQAKQLMRLFAAVLGGKVSGFEDNQPSFRNLADTKDVVTMVTDDKGNRVRAILLDTSE